MERLFPRALVACIGEGRMSDLQELSAMADEVCCEAIPNRLSQRIRRPAMSIPRAVLAGGRIGLTAGYFTEVKGRLLHP